MKEVYKMCIKKIICAVISKVNLAAESESGIKNTLNPTINRKKRDFLSKYRDFWSKNKKNVGKFGAEFKSPI